MIPVFVDNNNQKWTLDITVADIDRVRKNVHLRSGQAVDLLDIAERGDFSALVNDAWLLPTVIFWLCHEQVARRFSLEAYDQNKAYEYALDPDARNASPLQKAADWFGSLFGAEEYPGMGSAFQEAILNFIRPEVRAKIKAVMDRQAALQTGILERATEAALESLSDGAGGQSGSVQES